MHEACKSIEPKRGGDVEEEEEGRKRRKERGDRRTTSTPLWLLRTFLVWIRALMTPHIYPCQLMLI